MFVTLNVMKSQVKINESLKYVIRLPNHGQSMFHLHFCNRLVMNQSARGFLLHFQPCCIGKLSKPPKLYSEFKM
uniref:Uncharacterized protein n=1 Tax=Anguilla anguilla TaxID=7936 RepID=A0A0E9WVL2_ANGAN